jgi:thiosulfate dehydrogenase (quinone) large subunit
MNMQQCALTPLQQITLIFLRTFIGWHFFYEGYYKLSLPAWSPDGSPLAPWSSYGYLKSATGPIALLFQRLIDAGWTPWIDHSVKIGLLLIGISLILGLLTQIGCWGAVLFLTLFYLLNIPTKGIPEAGNEGTYLLINKNLLELAAVFVLISFRTNRIAGLDLFFKSNKEINKTSDLG